jgi:hypothetical protein
MTEDGQVKVSVQAGGRLLFAVSMLLLSELPVSVCA